MCVASLVYLISCNNSYHSRAKFNFKVVIYTLDPTPNNSNTLIKNNFLDNRLGVFAVGLSPEKKKYRRRHWIQLFYSLNFSLEENKNTGGENWSAKQREAAIVYNHKPIGKLKTLQIYIYISKSVGKNGIKFPLSRFICFLINKSPNSFRLSQLNSN